MRLDDKPKDGLLAKVYHVNIPELNEAMKQILKIFLKTFSSDELRIMLDEIDQEKQELYHTPTPTWTDLSKPQA